MGIYSTRFSSVFCRDRSDTRAASVNPRRGESFTVVERNRGGGNGILYIYYTMVDTRIVVGIHHGCGYKMRYIIILESARPFLRIPRIRAEKLIPTALRGKPDKLYFSTGVYIILYYT